MMDARHIEMQPGHVGCGLYAIINLFRALGHRAPNYAQLRRAHSELRREAYGEASPSPAAPLTLFDQFHLCAEFGAALPVTFGLWAIPPSAWRKPDGFLTGLLSQRALLLCGYQWRLPKDEANDGGLTGHSLVIEGFSEEGYQVLDSTGLFADGSVIELEPRPTSEEYRRMWRRQTLNKRGARRVLPYIPVRRAPSELGLEPFVVAAYPNTLDT
jgi:hypothetical protein